ncbi:MAG: cysteine--tRNA ligase [Chloroflexota bacterium]|nr:cysteine--tRNA ligase [Chloroflexota bacterium]
MRDTATRELIAVAEGDGPVTLYACGMTPKDKPHIGHARVFVMVDVLRRWLEYSGQEVQHVQNFTDVDDKIIERAQAQGRDPLELARANSDAYFSVMDRLEVRRAHLYPRVTDNMEAIIAAIGELIERGHAYATSSGVYFQVSTWPQYGYLSGRRGEDQLAGARVAVDEEKRDPRDFALWKHHKPGEIFWESPWGQGRPGWHIECSSMIRAHLGPEIEIHAGGSDLIFPHHENECAQAEAGFGVERFVRCWFHVGILRIGGEKMGHSLGNFLTLESLLDAYEPAVLRYYLVSTHYRSLVDFGDDSLPQAEAALARLRGPLRIEPAAAGSADAELAAAAGRANAEFAEAMNDDLNTTRAVAAVFGLAREINRHAGSVSAAGLEKVVATYRELVGVLGVDLEPAAQQDGDAGALLDLLLELRTRLRAEKNYAAADQIRTALGDLGYVIEDSPAGSSWRRA